MNAQDPLAEYFVSNPRQSPNLGGRAGAQGTVDAILNELRVPATLDKDGDWKLQTDVGPFLLMIDKESSDLVAIQTMQSMEKKVKNSADEMHGLMALNYSARGIARFGVVKDSEQNLLVLTARLAPEEVGTASVQSMLRDCMRLSRRVDELLGNAPPQAAQPGEPAQPGGWQAADAALAQSEGSGGDAPPAGDAPDVRIAGAADVTRMASPIPDPVPPGGAPAGGPAAGPEGPGGGAPAEPQPAEPASPSPASPSPASPAPAPAQPQQPAPVAPQAPAAPQPAPAAPLPPPQAQLPPANWYPDPHRQARLRYWDGQRWTEHVAN